MGDMTEWDDPEPEDSPDQATLAADLLGFTPASTPGREALAGGVQLGIVIVLLFVILPDRFSTETQWLILAGAVVYCATRVVSGIPKWRRHAERLRSAGNATGSLFGNGG